MGASFSTRLSESNMELRKRIDAAATEVVLDASFTDLTKLANEKNCNRLVKKVSDIFQKNKDVIDLELLRQKLYDQKRINGENVDNDATGSTADSDAAASISSIGMPNRVGSSANQCGAPRVWALESKPSGSAYQ